MNRYILRLSLPFTPRQGNKRFPDPTPRSPAGCASICVDVDNGTWSTRENWSELHKQLKTYAGTTATGSARGASLILYGRDLQVPLLECFKFDLSGSAPALSGHCGAFCTVDPQGDPMRYERHGYWWRVPDVILMSPYERMCEMLNLALTDPKLRNELKATFGSLASFEVLLPFAAILLVFAGAEFLGGAALVSAIGRLLGVSQFAADVAQYNHHITELHKILIDGGARWGHIENGARLLEELIVRMMQDIMMLLGVKAIAEAAKKLVSLIVSCAPAKWKAAATERIAEMQHKAAKQLANRYGYAGEQYLKRADGEVNFTKAERSAHQDVARDRHKIVVLREGKANRLAFMKSQVWVEGKPPWWKGKTGEGWFGIVGVLKKISKVEEGGLKRAGSYDTGNLRGISKEMDAELAKAKQLPMYEMPRDGRKILTADGKKAIDYDFSGHKHVELEGIYLVDLSPLGHDKYIAVHKTKGPIIGDNDIGVIYDPKAPPRDPVPNYANRKAAGEKFTRAERNPEDDLWLEFDINRRIWEYEKGHSGRLYNSAQHSGSGGSLTHGIIQQQRGEPHWSPYDAKKGKWEDERLVVYLPVRDRVGRWTAEEFVVDSWADLRQFFKDNKFAWPDGVGWNGADN